MASKRGKLSTKIISPELNRALNKAATLMQDKRQKIITAELLLLAFITTPDVEAYQLLHNFSRERGFDWGDFTRDAERAASDRRLVRDIEFDFITADNKRTALSTEMLVLLDDGLAIAESQGETECGTAHALAIMADIKVGTHWLLSRRGVTNNAVMDELTTISVVNYTTTSGRKKKQQAVFYYRTELLDKLMNLLSMTSGRHVILVGAAGVGKRSLVFSMAQLIAQGRGPATVKTVVELDERALLDNALEAVKLKMRQARGGVLFVPDIARFFGGIRAEFREDVCNLMQKAFFSDNVVIIGEATEERYSKKLSVARPIIENSQVLRVPPATMEETAEILKLLKPKFENDYGLTIVDDSLEETARLAGRYFAAEPLPGAAVHLLHRACALIKMRLIKTGSEIKIKDDNRLDSDDVMAATGLLTGIPVSKMGADERDRYVNMVDHLRKRIIGQNEAVLAISRAVKMARVGLKDPKRPIGSFMFLGPTGVGKTELAKALAEFMFDTEKALITLDMSEYMEDSSVNRFIGSPPGYVGHEAGGQLTDAVKNQPYSVVLFDEVEKASTKLFDVLLQVLDEGRLTSGQGETISFSECVILMTSNIGSKYLADPELSESFAREATEQELKKSFRPEFLNRLDDIVYFNLLTDNNLYAILTLLLHKEKKLMAGRNIQMDITPAVKKWLLAQNDHPEWGARPLRRIIQKNIREPVADFLLSDNLQEGAAIKIRVKGGQLLFER